MKLRVVFNTDGHGTSLFELEASAYHIDPRTGALTVTGFDSGGAPSVIVVYAAGTWRSIADVGALAAAIDAAKSTPKATSETPRRRQEVRQAQAT